MLYTLAGRGGGVFVCACVFLGGVGGGGGWVVNKDNRQSKTPHHSHFLSYPPSKLCGAIPQFLPMLTKRSVCKQAPLQPRMVFCINVPKSLVLNRRALMPPVRPVLWGRHIRWECLSKSHHSGICIPKIWTICLLLWYKNKLNFIY